MKKILLGAALLAVTGVNAQLFSESFDASIPATWTIHDVDGLTSTSPQSDFASWAWDGGEQSASSSSWYNNSGLGPTDDWLVTPGIVIPATGVFQLEFIGKSYEATYAEEYEVHYSITGSDVADFTNPALISVVDESDAGTFRTAVLPPATAGQTVYIAFRHTSDDESMLGIDDVVVRELMDDDIQMISLSFADIVTAGNVNISGTVKNNGANTINSFTLTYDAGAGVVSETVTQTIATGATYNFTHSTPFAATTAGSPYSIEVCASITGDGDVNNNCLTKSVGVVSSIVDKYVVIEEKTGTWCQYCPSGAAAMDNTGAVEPRMIGIAVHNSDPMAVSSYDSGSDGFPDFSGYPYAAADRVNGAHAATIQTLFNGREGEVPPASISFTTAAELTAGTITVTPSADMVATLSGGNYRLGVILIEDDVTGTGSGWMQVNAYSGAQSVPHGSENWQNLPNPTDVSTVFGGYDHVGRALGNNQINGDASSLPATLTDGQSYEYTYTFNVNAAWDVSKMKAVAIFVNNTTGEILNAGKTDIQAFVGLTEETFNFNTVLFPNPTKNTSQLKLSLNEAAEVSIEVVDMVGKVVNTIDSKELAQGDYVYTLNFSNQPSGVYFANVNVNGAVKTVKVNVSK